MDWVSEALSDELICKVNIATLKSVCERNEWMKFEFKIGYLKLARLFFL